MVKVYQQAKTFDIYIRIFKSYRIHKKKETNKLNKQKNTKIQI